jgi:chromosome segregation ATPase
MSRLGGFLVVGALGLAGCSLFQKGSDSVSPEQLAKIPPSQMGPVNQAQAELKKAENEVASRDRALQGLQNEVNVATQGVNVANAQVEQTKAVLNKANFDRNSEEGLKAMRDQTLSEAKQDAAQAHLSAANAALDLGKAQKREGEAQRDLAQAKLDLTGGEALKASGDPSGKDLNVDSMRAKVEERSKQVEQAGNDVAKLQTQTDRAHGAWQVANQHLNELSGTGGAPSPH